MPTSEPKPTSEPHHDDLAYRAPPFRGEDAPLVSVITVCWNSAETIRDTLESVVEQDHPRIEYIVIDGASTDGTLDILAEYEDHIDVLVSEPDEGLYDAINKGIERATGDVVALLNSDDVYASPSSLRHLIEAKVQAGTKAVFADLVYVKRNDPSRVVRYYRSKGFTPERLADGWMPAHPTVIVDREAFERFGGYALDYEIASDYDMMIRLFALQRLSYTYLDEVAVRMRDGGLSTANLRSRWVLNTEIVRACRRYGLRTSMLRLALKVPSKMLELAVRPSVQG